MKKKRRVVLSLILVLAMCCQLPVAAGAVVAESNSANSLESLMQPYQEDFSLRSSHTKHFHYGNGGYIAATYTEPVHYLDKNGNWQDIDNSLLLVTPASSNNGAAEFNMQSSISQYAYYENAANAFHIRMPQTLKAESPIQVTYNGFSIAFSPVGTQETTSMAEIETPLQVTQKIDLLAQAASADLSGNQEEAVSLRKEATTILEDQASALHYDNIFANTMFRYEVSGQKLKESIILSKPTEQENFSFSLTYEGLTPVIQEFGAVHFFPNGCENDDPVFIIQAPYMEDSGEDDDLSTEIDVHVEPTETGCIYTITPDPDWLKSSDRVYPITIDPTLTTSTAAVDIQDNGVNVSDPNTNYMTVNRMYVGSNLSGSTAQESRIYIRFPRIAEIPSSAYIHKATMYLNHYPTTSYQTANNNVIEVYDVGSNNWSSSTITWNSQKNYNFGAKVASTTVNSPLTNVEEQFRRNEFDITSIVRSWYATTATNNGIVLKPKVLDTTKTNRVCYYSSDCDASKASYRPRVSVEYFVGSPTAGITSGASFFIKNQFSQKYLTVGSTNSAGTAAIQHEYTGNPNQRWIINHVGAGVYSLTPQSNTSLRLDVPNANDADGQNLQLFPYTGYSAQLFRFIENSNGTYRIIAALESGTRTLDVEGPSENNGANIQIWTWQSTATQMQWTLESTHTQMKSASAIDTMVWLPGVIGDSYVPITYQVTLTCYVTYLDNASSPNRIVTTARSYATYDKRYAQQVDQYGYPSMNIRDIVINGVSLSIMPDTGPAITDPNLARTERVAYPDMTVGASASFSSYVLCRLNGTAVPVDGFSCDFTF